MDEDCAAREALARARILSELREELVTPNTNVKCPDAAPTTLLDAYYHAPADLKVEWEFPTQADGNNTGRPPVVTGIGWYHHNNNPSPADGSSTSAPPAAAIQHCVLKPGMATGNIFNEVDNHDAETKKAVIIVDKICNDERFKKLINKVQNYLDHLYYVQGKTLSEPPLLKNMLLNHNGKRANFEELLYALVEEKINELKKQDRHDRRCSREELLYALVEEKVNELKKQDRQDRSCSRE